MGSLPLLEALPRHLTPFSSDGGKLLGERTELVLEKFGELERLAWVRPRHGRGGVSKGRVPRENRESGSLGIQ